MTQPTPTPDQILDRAVIDASEEFTRAQLAQPRDPERIDAARQAYLDALAARWPDA